MRLVAAGQVVETSKPLVMGVVNATPDSFSDAGLHATASDQVAHGLKLVEAGADLLDVGGLSAVTNKPAISVDEEATRVVPVIAGLRDAGVELISVDTWRGDVAAAAVEAGASIVNDISGLEDPGLATVCARTGAALVLMHTRSKPKTRAVDLDYDDITEEVREFLAGRIEAAAALGVNRESTIIDPGPDFSKSPAQTVELLRALPDLRSLERPILLAVSRKDFVGALTGRRPRDRGAGTLAAIGHGLDAGVSILRVHDVAPTVDYLAVRAALRGETELSPDTRLPEHLLREEHP